MELEFYKILIKFRIKIPHKFDLSREPSEIQDGLGM